jgi:hypothetical protein
MAAWKCLNHSSSFAPSWRTLVEIPDITAGRWLSANAAAIVGAMFSAPSADGLIGDSDPALKQHFLNVAQAEREPVIEPDSAGDNLWRETMVLLWLPPVVQEVSDLLNVRSSAVFCKAFYVRHFQKPLAGMVICGSGPNFVAELLPAAYRFRPLPGKRSAGGTGLELQGSTLITRPDACHGEHRHCTQRA